VFNYPPTPHLDQIIKTNRAITQKVEKPRSQEILNMFLAGLAGVGSIVGLSYGIKNSNSPTSAIGCLGLGASLILGIWRYQKFEKYDAVYAPAHAEALGAEQQIQLIHQKTEIDARTARKNFFENSFNILTTGVSEISERLEDTPLHTNNKFLKDIIFLQENVGKAKEGYKLLHPDYKIQKPSEETLEMTLVPQYKTVTVTRTKEIEQDYSHGHHSNHTSQQNTQHSHYNHSGSHTSVHPTYNPLSPPPYNPEWPGFVPATQPVPQTNYSNDNSYSHHSSHTSTTNHGNNTQNRQKDRVMTVEQRVLDDEQNTQNKLKVKTFREFYTALEKTEKILNILRQKTPKTRKN
jgi:hypothetical protein